MTRAGPDTVVAKVRRRWEDGSLLRAYCADEPFPRIEVPLRGPGAADIGDDLTAVRAWITKLDNARRDDAHYALEWAEVGGRHIGRNRIPKRAVLTRYEQAWALLGVRAQVERFREVLALSERDEPLRLWALAHPHRALDLYDEWPRLLAAYRWLDTHRGSGRYLREISAPGVDTKFAERHRAVLASLLDVPNSATGFVVGLGLRPKPELVRLRAPIGAIPGVCVGELAVRVDDLAAFPVSPDTVVICENEITYLSVPVPESGMVIWGKGFDVYRLGRLPWLAACDIDYWGDLDTHGFAILDRLRAWYPQARSLLMDRDTLLEHRDRWGTEAKPTSAQLIRLTEDEREVYEDLVTDRYATRLRLEQERIDWQWALARLPLSIATEPSRGRS